MATIQAVVRFAILYVNKNGSTRWKKTMTFSREPHLKELVELWPDGPSLPLIKSTWTCGGELTFELPNVPVGYRLEGWERIPDTQRLRRYEPDGPTAEQMASGGWEEA